MNRDFLRKNIGYRMQLIPTACRLDDQKRELPPIADEWIVESVTEETIQLSNPRTAHVLTLGMDHVHSFTSNPASSRGEIKHGFLKLHVQVFLDPRNCWVYPTARPGEPFRFASPVVVEQWVDFQYPTRSGLLRQMSAKGYELKWSLENNLARLTTLEGWELVEEPNAQGGLTRYRVRDFPYNQVLIRRLIQRF